MSPGPHTLRSWLAVSSLILVSVLLVGSAFAQPAGLADLAGPFKAMALDAAAGNMGTQSVSRLGIRTQGNLVQAQILFTSEAAAAATGLGKFGGTVQFRRDRRVQAMVPVNQLLNLAALPQVAQVGPASQMLPLQGYGGVSSQGVQLTNATAMHLAGILGQGVRVAVIDAGFADLNVAEVPVVATAPNSIVSFRADASTTASSHGTAVAQVLADMAPGCSMTLIAVDTPESVEAAVDYIIAQRIQVVNMSMGVFDGPFDGTHPLSVAVNRARNAGVFWVNSAGNQAQQHWEGTWQDPDSDRLLEFSGTKDYIALNLSAGTFSAVLSWFETAGPVTDRDYDLVLTDTSAGANVIARSAVTQNGDDPARENLLAYISTAGVYHLRIERMPNSAIADNEKFQLFTPEVDLEGTAQVTQNSLAIPAEATGAFSVGATRADSTIPATGTYAGLPVDRIEPFSSRGPVGSTAKPEMVAPDFVSIGASGGLVGLNPFSGTSAAAPHVAGAAALLLAEDQARSADTLRTMLMMMAKKIEPPTIPDTDINAYGAGRLSLRVGADTDGEAPVARIEFPGNNSTITVASPRLIGTLTDNGGIDVNTVQIWLDDVYMVKDGVVQPGTPASEYVINPETGDVSLLLSNLTRTRHTVKLQVSDEAGNASAIAASNFRINTPTISAGLHIIGLPYPDLATADPSVVFGVPINGANPMALIRWVPSDSRFSKYHIYPDDFASFAPPDQLVARPPAGLGYFLSLPSTGTLNITAAGLTDDSYNIELVYGNTAPRGWNLIGNPYEDYVDWGSVEFISENGRQDLREAMDAENSPVTEGVLFDWVSSAGGGYYSFPADPTLDTMEPLKGYWVHVLKDATLVVHNTGSTALSAARAKRAQPKAAAPSAQNWLLKLEARAGKYEDPVNYIGVSAKGSDGYDPGLDVSEPPPLVDALRMYMPAQSGTYAKDVRAGNGTQQRWKVEVACRLKNVPVTITWPDINASIPRGVSLRLEDADSGQSVYMRTATGYTFQLAEPGVRHLEIVADASAAGSLVVSGLAAAQTRGGGVALTYAVTRAADVTVDIRNISGVLIRTLGQTNVSPGTTQTVLWNGQSDRGAKAPAGKYFARITARAADGQTVQAIRPFDVNR